MALVSSAVPRGHNPHRRCGSTSSRAGNTLSSAGLDVFVDDRDERPGVKFVDADLIGFPVRLVVNAKKEGKVEIKFRKTGETLLVGQEDVLDTVLRGAVNL